MGVTAVARGQGAGGTEVQLRAVVYDPVNPIADLYTPGKSGTTAKLELQSGGLSAVQTAVTVNGSIMLYSTATIDLAKPTDNLVVSMKVPGDVKRGIAVIIPGPPGSKPAYRGVLIDDSAKGFPKGESKILSLIPLEAAIQAGEHKIPVSPGKIADVPEVKEVNEFNMAQTNFFYKRDKDWVPITERQVQYLDAFRRIFIIHVIPGSDQPSISTIVDTAPAVIPDPT